MKSTARILAAGLLMVGCVAAHSHEAVKAAANPEALFTSPDPKLHANKQVAYKIVRDLLEAGHWDKAGDYLTKRYIQHNPLAESGLDGVIYYFTQVAKVKPKPIPEKIKTPVVSVTAEGDLVVVTFVREVKDPKDPTKTYTTTWFDMFRVGDGKLVEHWDTATIE